jgi:two-component system chemotaxis response regulator CheY
MNNSLKKFNVLVIDDDVLIRDLVRDALLKLGFGGVLEASNGKKGLRLLETKPVDFVICDWRMPEMDGIEFTRRVRTSAGPYDPHVPIIMLTGNAEIEQVREARDAGVNEYVVKPFAIKELCMRIESIVENPREFVLAPVYKGPTRRRKSKGPPDGVDRRANRGRTVRRSS